MIDDDEYDTSLPQRNAVYDNHHHVQKAELWRGH